MSFLVRCLLLVPLFWFAIGSLPRPQSSDLIIETFGTSLTEYGGWQGPLASRLSACLSRAVKIQNYGMGAKDSYWGVRTAPLFARHDADIALVEFAINDAYLPFDISLQQSKENTLAIIRDIRTASPDAKIYLMSMNPTFDDAERPRLAEYYRQYASIAREASVGFIDLFPVWEAGLKDVDIYKLLPDGAHPSVSAYDLVLPNMAGAIGGPSCTSQ